MRDGSDEEQQERLIGVGDGSISGSVATTAAKDVQLNGPVRARVLPAFRRRRWNEEESLPEGHNEQADDQDELCPSEYSATHLPTLALEPPSVSPQPRRCLHKSTCSIKTKSICRVITALGITLAVAIGLALGLIAAAYEGLWSWREWFPYKAELFNPVKACKKVHSGEEWPCGSPWSAPCFDRSRCAVNGSDVGVLSIYVHDEMCSMARSSEIFAGYTGEAVASPWNKISEALRMAAISRNQLAETPEEACIVVYGVPRESECVSRTRSWRGGQNHLILDLNDQSRNMHASLDKKAMFGESTMRPCYFRYGYDIALPLAALKLFHNLRKIPPEGRKYFATFKGSLYLSGDGNTEREAVRNIGQTSQDTDVVVVEHCETANNEHALSWNVALCQGLEKDFDDFDYGDLMNTTFALLPAGRSPATHRLGEVLSAGTIPIFVHDHYVKPFPGRIPWSKFSLSFPAEEASRILQTLRAIPKEKLVDMQATSLEVFNKYFGNGMDGIVHTTLDILEHRLSFQA